MVPCQQEGEMQCSGWHYKKDWTVTLLPLREKQVKCFVVSFLFLPQLLCLQNVNFCSQGEEWFTLANMMSAFQIKKKRRASAQWTLFVFSSLKYHLLVTYGVDSLVRKPVHCNTSLFRENWSWLRVYVYMCVSVCGWVSMCGIHVPVCTRAFQPSIHSSCSPLQQY